MRYRSRIWYLAALILVGVSSHPGFAQDEPEGTPAPTPTPDDGWTQPVEYSPAEKRANCRQYEGKYLSYYDMVYLVEKCSMREIQSSELIFRLNQQKVKFYVVEAKVLAMLEKGEPVLGDKLVNAPTRSCKQLETKYVTYTYTNVYYVQKCKRRPFPDWASFIEHRKEQGRQKEEVLSLTWKEFLAIPEGRSMLSVVDMEYSKQKIMARNVDIIPIDTACKGLNGKDVSYVDSLYRIEKCRKRIYDPIKFLKDKRHQDLRFTELTSEQWISLPDGAPMK